MREEVARGALLKSANELPVVLATGAGVTVRRVGTRIERSTDKGVTWAVDLISAPPTLQIGTCPTVGTCWVGGSHGVVLVRQPSGTWTRHVVGDARADVLGIDAGDALTATVRLSDGRSFRTSDGGTTWVESK